MPEVGIELVRSKGHAWPSAAAKNPAEVDLPWPRDPFTEVDLALGKSANTRI